MNLLLNVLWEKNVPLLQVFSLCNLSFLCCRDACKFHAISFLIWGVIFYAIILIHSFLAMLKQHGQTIYGGFPVVSILVSHRCLLLS